MLRRVLSGVVLVCLAGWTFLSGCGENTSGGAKQAKPKIDHQKANTDRWKDELQRFGAGDWARWAQSVAPFHQAVRAELKAAPSRIKGIVGTDGFLFFRGSLDYLVAGELRGQPDGRDPYPAIVEYAQRLKAQGVDMLFCPIPVKATVFPDKMPGHKVPLDGPYVNPYQRKLMLELAEAGVECVDLLPQFIASRNQDGGPAYQKLDTHWTPRTLRLTARILAERIRDYDWFPQLASSPKAYTVKKVEFKRRGDIVLYLRPSESRKYPPETIAAEQVIEPDGSFYADDQTSKIVMLGDSYAGAFHFQDCKYAGISAHLARELGVPIDLLQSQGGGPKLWGLLARRGEGALKDKKLVIWLMSTRDLYNYRDPWKVIPVR